MCLLAIAGPYRLGGLVPQEIHVSALCQQQAFRPVPQEINVFVSRNISDQIK
jgi:hypothetical protein